jgi:hypothetical protein
MKRRYCDICGEDISHRPKHHYLCYDCWKNENSTYNPITNNYETSRHFPHYNQTYEERYKGDSEYDMGAGWDYDEYPPENL